jgi:hypothetical protein
VGVCGKAMTRKETARNIPEYNWVWQ